MESSVFSEDMNEPKKISIVGSELVENYTLTAEKKIDKNLLPPKKIIGKNSKTLVEKRQKELEAYLQTLLLKFPVVAPKVLSCFLHFHLYEINGITAALAEELFHKGEQLLAAGQVFLLRPMQLYAITQQLRLAKPTCANGDAKADLGHILDFTCRLKYLKIPGSRGTVGTSNIQEHLLPFDLSVFKSLLHIEIAHCDFKQINGLPSLKQTLATMSIHYSASSMKEVLVPEALEFAQWEAEGVASGSPVTAIIPTWKTLTTLDMSHNRISCIDESVKSIPKVEFLDISHNELSVVGNLQHLYNLIHLDLSYNKIAVLEGVHTKVGNIKTLNLAGNLIEDLSGLNKLYSLVNLDLSNNKLAQLHEIKNIGSLPCLEKLSLLNNPLSIIPDYRTKVLAQFWDRASEVCLDSIVTTEKELDTIEVLKAIQKAKAAKDRMSNNEKKISEESALSAAGSKSICCSSAARPSSPSLSPSASSSQEIICKETALDNIKMSTSVDSAIAQECCNYKIEVFEETVEYKKHTPSSSLLQENTSDHQSSCCCSGEDRNIWKDYKFTPVLPLSCVSHTATDLDFTAYLTGLISKALWESNQRECHTDKNNGGPKEVRSPCSSDGYFEMDLGEREDKTGCSTSSDVLVEGPEDLDSEVVHITKVHWLYCIKVNKGMRQTTSCVVLTSKLLVVFIITQEEVTTSLQSITDHLNIDLAVPYTEIETVGFYIPEACLSLKIKTCDTWWYFLSDSQSLKEIFCLMSGSNPSLKNSSFGLSYGDVSQKDFISHLLESQEYEEGDIKGAYAAHLLDSAKVPPCNQHTQSIFADFLELEGNSPHSDLFSQVWQSEMEKELFCIPCFLFLSPRYLYIIKVDFFALARTSKDQMPSDSCVKLTKIPLAFVLLDSQQKCASSSALAAHRFHDSHVLQLLTGYKFVTAVFVLPHDNFLFRRLFSHVRSSLRDVKTVAFFQTKNCTKTANSCQLNSTVTKETPECSLQDLSRPRLTLSLLYPSDPLIQKLSDENQCPFHLSVSPSLHFLASLKGNDLVEFFYNSIAEVENEELKHILWSSVVFYRSPEMEITACIMLSTKALYFVLDNSASQLADQTLAWNWKPDVNKRDFMLSYCFALKMNDLISVNIGLFDQYFRVVGPSADQIISCLTRDSYGTHRFIQQLMTVLSLLEKLPSPEPLEQDFYTEFGNKNRGKMENYELVHSSRVTFIYPSEEEIGDLTYTVAEKMGELHNPQSFNILLYMLVFQVHHCESSELGNKYLLQPKTLILTSSDIFLFDEDYISYPLPEFAKEPPRREKYFLTDARRVRDLDRVLMGYQTYPQALTFVFDDFQSPDMLCNLTMDHFGNELSAVGKKRTGCSNDREVQWCVFVPAADSREKLISLLARQWETLCSRELPVELTG
ncbi:nischarin isoform X3 [Lepisosteus oculatus]|uniref:nischarin isoform X3 n=1 Tax=Lepisosteus oculatus TaxID=7918 RepID=UPI000740331E|nr:PREDICTED: nischarin isoform X3 [Lepisosteus oculatus]